MTPAVKYRMVFMMQGCGSHNELNLCIKMQCCVPCSQQLCVHVPLPFAVETGITLAWFDSIWQLMMDQHSEGAAGQGAAQCQCRFWGGWAEREPRSVCRMGLAACGTVGACVFSEGNEGRGSKDTNEL